MLGRNLVNRFATEGHEILGVSREDNTEGVKTLNIDLLNKKATKEVIEDMKPDVVYHLAANAAESRGQVSPIDMTERNLNIFLHVLVPSMNIKVKRFIYTSSVAVYGDAPVPYDEREAPMPKDIYGVNKWAAEQTLRIMNKVHGLNYTIFRPHNIYGPHQDMTNPYKNVVALFMRSLMLDEPVTLFGEGKMKRAFSYVEDVADTLAAALDDRFNNLTLNVGSVAECTIAELLEEIEKVTGKKAKKIMKPARPQEIMFFLAKRGILDTLHTYRETPLRIGLQKTWESINLPEVVKEENEIQTS